MPISRRAVDSQDFYFLIAFSGLFCYSWGRCVKIGLGSMPGTEYVYSLIPPVLTEFLWLPVIMCPIRHIKGCHSFPSGISLDTLFCVNSRMLWLTITLIYGSVRNRIQCVRLWNGCWVGKHCLSPHPDLGGLWAPSCLTAGIWGCAGSPCSDIGAASHPLPGGSFFEVS